MNRKNIHAMTLFFVVFFCFTLTACSKTAYYPKGTKPPKIIPKKEVKEEVATVKPIPKLKKLIVIDAGHGGKDFGAKSLCAPVFHEKNLTLTTANLVTKYLQNLGYRTIMTRTDDTFIELSDRASFANVRKPKAFVSVHYNSAPARQAHGIEVYYYDSEKNKLRSMKSKAFAKNVLDEVIDSTGVKSRGVKHGNFAVIRETDMPAVLVECGFMTNHDEMKKIRKPDYLKKLAWGIAHGVDNYLNGK